MLCLTTTQCTSLSNHIDTQVYIIHIQENKYLQKRQCTKQIYTHCSLYNHIYCVQKQHVREMYLKMNTLVMSTYNKCYGNTNYYNNHNFLTSVFFCSTFELRFACWNTHEGVHSWKNETEWLKLSAGTCKKCDITWRRHSNSLQTGPSTASIGWNIWNKAVGSRLWNSKIKSQPAFMGEMGNICRKTL